MAQRDSTALKPAEFTADGRAGLVGESVKTFVLDTNVLLHDPGALFVFDEHDVVIPFEVIEELDTFKSRNDETGRAARETIRHLDSFRQRGVLADGVDVIHPTTGERGGKLQVILDTNGIDVPGLREPTADNHIIRCSIKMQHLGKRSVFVSKDIAARIKAHAMGVPVEDYENKKVNFDGLYTGYREHQAPSELIDAVFHSDEPVEIDRLELENLHANEFVLLHNLDNPTHTALVRVGPEGQTLMPVKPLRRHVYGILPRNLQQQIALDLLLDDEVRLVSLIGQAGTGKTLLALAAGMQRVVSDGRYTKLLAARPIMPMGRDIGYLPGDKDEKLGAWMQPIFDNLTYLLGGRVHHGGDDKAADHKQQMKGAESRVETLMRDGTVVLEPLTYIRGRSIPEQFMIVDEAQNLTPHEIKTIASRVGEGTKLVFTGDPTQIDNPYLDASSNGLTYLVEKLKGRGLVGHVTLAKSERSELASLAAEAL
ncbi:MAG: PhoH family protein [Planctomycetota bacterium]